jgi:hypothetical protein
MAAKKKASVCKKAKAKHKGGGMKNARKEAITALENAQHNHAHSCYL